MGQVKYDIMSAVVMSAKRLQLTGCTVLQLYKQFVCDSTAVKTKLWYQAVKALNLQERSSCIKLFLFLCLPVSVFFYNPAAVLGQRIADRNVALQKPLVFSWTGRQAQSRNTDITILNGGQIDNLTDNRNRRSKHTDIYISSKKIYHSSTYAIK